MRDINGPQINDSEVADEATQQRNRRWWMRFSIGAIALLVIIGIGVYVNITGTQEDADKVTEMVNRHPIVIEKLGGIRECKYNFIRSLTEGGKRTDVYDVRGPKGSGQFVTHELFFVIHSIVLRTEDGEWELLDE